MAETHLIRIYRSEITTPNTTTDPVIAIEYSIGPQAHNYSWAESIGGWPTGRFYVRVPSILLMQILTSQVLRNGRSESLISQKLAK